MLPKFIITINQDNSEYNIQVRIIYQGQDYTKGFKCATLDEAMAEIERRIQRV